MSWMARRPTGHNAPTSAAERRHSGNPTGCPQSNTGMCNRKCTDCAELTVSAIAVHSLASELSYSHRRLGPMVSGIQVDEVKNCHKGEITTIRIFTVSQSRKNAVGSCELKAQDGAYELKTSQKTCYF